jgi:hypoxanthine phosphoribosyltransferase
MDLLISPEEIAGRIQETASQLDNDYEGKQLTVIMVMKGSICVASDLIRALKTPCTLEYIKASSYGHNGMTPGELFIDGFDWLNIADKDVLVVDDIFDTGRTMDAVLQKLETKNPRSLKSLVLLVKDVPHKVSMLPDYTLFVIGNRFVVGYGLDYNEYYRGLPGIYAFTNDIPPD